jgi:hypothetical protein
VKASNRNRNAPFFSVSADLHSVGAAFYEVRVHFYSVGVEFCRVGGGFSTMGAGFYRDRGCFGKREIPAIDEESLFIDYRRPHR